MSRDPSLERTAASLAVTTEGPFFHGTKADLRIGDLLTAGFRSNYRSRVAMNHVPLKVVGELESWEPCDPEFIRQLRVRIEAGMGEIIN